MILTRSDLHIGKQITPDRTVDCGRLTNLLFNNGENMKFIGTISPIDQENVNFIDQLTKFLKDNVCEFSGDLIGGLEHINHRAVCYNGIEIDDISKSSDGEYQLDYSYDWFVYNGCADMNESDKFEDSTFVYVDEDGNVEIEVPDLSERTTADEF